MIQPAPQSPDQWACWVCTAVSQRPAAHRLYNRIRYGDWQSLAYSVCYWEIGVHNHQNRKRMSVRGSRTGGAGVHGPTFQKYPFLKVCPSPLFISDSPPCRLNYSAKWMKWMAEIMCSFDVCVSVCLYVRSGRSWELNANSSKTVTATDFKFDTRVPRDSSHMTSKNFPKRGCGQGHVTP